MLGNRLGSSWMWVGDFAYSRDTTSIVGLFRNCDPVEYYFACRKGNSFRLFLLRQTIVVRHLALG